MTAAAPALERFREALDQLLELLIEHRANRVLPGVRNLRAQADEPGAPAAVLADLDRAYWQLMGIPDGLSALYFTGGSGGVDRAATDRLEQLRRELAAALRAGEQRTDEQPGSDEREASA